MGLYKKKKEMKCNNAFIDEKGYLECDDQLFIPLVNVASAITDRDIQKKAIETLGRKLDDGELSRAMKSVGYIMGDYEGNALLSAIEDFPEGPDADDEDKIRHMLEEERLD